MLTPKTTQKTQMLPLTVTYNRILPNIKQTIWNHWSILKTNKTLEKTFSVEPIIAFRKNKSQKQLIGGNVIQNDKNIKNQATNMKRNVNFVNLEYGLCVVYSYKTHTFISSPTKWVDIYNVPPSQLERRLFHLSFRM